MKLRRLFDSPDGAQGSASVGVVDDEIRAYYETGVELDRVAGGTGESSSPGPRSASSATSRRRPPRVLDVGGGPLYHLVDRDDRLTALGEARRVLRSGGLLAAAAISRFASLLDGLLSGHLRDAEGWAIVQRDLGEGQHRSPRERPDHFTTAYFHRPEELRAEVEEAGFSVEALFGVEGPGWLREEHLDDELAREDVLRVARALEQEPTTIGTSAHILVIARRP